MTIWLLFKKTFQFELSWVIHWGYMLSFMSKEFHMLPKIIYKPEILYWNKYKSSLSDKSALTHISTGSTVIVQAMTITRKREEKKHNFRIFSSSPFYSSMSLGIYHIVGLSGLVTAALCFSGATYSYYQSKQLPWHHFLHMHSAVVYMTNYPQHAATWDWQSSGWVGSERWREKQSCNVGVMWLSPRVGKPQGRHGFDRRTPTCLVRRTSGSRHARMLIGTSISLLMSAN